MSHGHSGREATNRMVTMCSKAPTFLAALTSAWLAGRHGIGWVPYCGICPTTSECDPRTGWALTGPSLMMIWRHGMDKLRLNLVWPAMMRLHWVHLAPHLILCRRSRHRTLIVN